MQNLQYDHDTEVTPSKENRIKLWSSIIKQPNVEGWN
jgi:hypothetical protein